MSFDIDSGIFIAFLVVTLVAGLFSSRGTKNIQEYAVGDRRFSTATIVATIIATWIGGEFFYVNLAESYTNGLNHIWVAVLGDFFAILIVGTVLAPRMGEFLGKLSIAEAMGSLFGDRIRIITSVSGFIGASGAIAVELKLSGIIFEYALGIPSVYGVILATIIVTLYSSLGGIKSVTFTDIIQFFTFGVVIPIVAYALLISIDNIDMISNTLNASPLFDYKEVFDFSNPLSLHYLFLFLFFLVPPFGPANFQRVAIAKNTNQISKSFTIAAFTCLFFSIIVGWIAVLVLSINPGIGSDDAIKLLIFNSSFTGLKGAMLAGIMAMIMSTVDSYINATSVLIVHDFLKPLKMNFIKSELISARIASVLIGIFALNLALYEGTLLELIIITCSFYMPIVTVPFIMAIMGFRSTEKSVIIGMLAGFITVISWDYLWQIKIINSVFMGMISNLIFLIGSHYLLKQEGGWVGIKDTIPLTILRNQRKENVRQFLLSLKSFNFITICKENCPRGEGLISILGIFVMISGFSNVHTLDQEYQLQYSFLINALYPLTLCSSMILISYPLWLDTWKKTKIIAVLWNLIMFLVLICFGFLMVLFSKFSEIQLMVFMINIIIISSVAKWKWSLFNILFGTILMTIYYQRLNLHGLDISFISSQFKVVYLLLLIISTLVVFLKPKQDFQEKTEQKSDYLSHKLDDQTIELKKSLELKQEFLRNLEHEARTPITSISIMGSILDESYDKLTENQRRKAIKDIAKSSERLNSLISNILDLSKLSGLNYQLNITDIDFSELVYERVKICRKLYTEDKYKELQEVTLDIRDNIIVSCDKNYITTAIDNIIINALQYCTDGKITIKLYKNRQEEVFFAVQDEGIGIPKEELYDVFGAFTVSSKTKTPAGGRGVGLALSKKVVDLHNGGIWAKQNSDKGVTVGFNLPLKNKILD